MYERAGSSAYKSTILSLEYASPRRTPRCGVLYLNSELLETRYTRPQKRIDTLDDPIQIVIFLWRRRRKLYMQRADETARVLWPKLRFPIRRESLDRSKLFGVVRK